MAADQSAGPLAGVRVIEIAGMGPAPFAAMLLADMGCEVVRVERPGAMAAAPVVLNRGKRSIVLDLSDAAGTSALLDLVGNADILIESFRPGVVERLGIGPHECLERNPKLVYGRMTGWGQDGPRSREAGHDIGYIALTGALHAIGPRAGPPSPPLALVGDLGGGAMFLVTGVLAALHEASSSGLGQVVDAAIVDGAAALMTPMYGMMAQGHWVDERESNLLDGGCPWYQTYRTRDGKWLAVAAIEPKFWLELLNRLGLSQLVETRHDPATWPVLRQRMSSVIASRSRGEWEQAFEGSDACVAPVRSMTEAPHDPHLAARRTFVDVGGHWQPAPAPRFGRTASATPAPPARVGADTVAILDEWGVENAEELLAEGVAQQL